MMIWIIQFSSNSNEIGKYYSTSSIYQPFEFILEGMVYQKTPIFFHRIRYCSMTEKLIKSEGGERFFVLVFVFQLTIMVFWTSALRFMSRFVFCLLTILAKYNYTTLEWGLQLVVGLYYITYYYSSSVYIYNIQKNQYFCCCLLSRKRYFSCFSE